MSTYPDAPGHRNVETSVAAADALAPKLGRLQRMAEGAIREAGWLGLTADELAERLIAAACEQLLEVSGAATADGLEGAVSEWSKRFIDAAMTEIPAAVFCGYESKEAA